MEPTQGYPAPMELGTTTEICSGTQRRQQGFAVISWNVLHMCHEIKYSFDCSPVINHYLIDKDRSNEKSRLIDIVKTLSELLTELSTLECFVCLQEVPGDALPMLREMLAMHGNSISTGKPLMHVQTYSRMPSLKRGQGISPYIDSSESLVTIHCGPRISSGSTMVAENVDKCLLSDDRIGWTPCPTDAGKGALTITTASGISVTNVHLPYRSPDAALLLRNMPWPKSGDQSVLVGDMNHYSDTLMKMIAEVAVDKLPPGAVFPVPTKNATRVGMRRNGSRDYSWIDYFVVSASLKDLVMLPPNVYDRIGDISDHFPIKLEFKCQ